MNRIWLGRIGSQMFDILAAVAPPALLELALTAPGTTGANTLLELLSHREHAPAAGRLCLAGALEGPVRCVGHPQLKALVGLCQAVDLHVSEIDSCVAVTAGWTLGGSISVGENRAAIGRRG